MAQIPLSDAIEALREQLQISMKAGDGKSLRFDIQDLELELQTMVTREATGKAGGKAGIKFWLVSGEASSEVAGKLGSSSVQTIKLKLRPRDEKGGDVPLGADVPLAG